MPRQASPATSAAASSGDRRRGRRSQNRALTCAIPTRDTASSWDCASGQPGVLVDHLGDRVGAVSVVTRSTRSRTAGSLVRSDSNTSRNAPVSLAT